MLSSSSCGSFFSSNLNLNFRYGFPVRILLQLPNLNLYIYKSHFATKKRYLSFILLVSFQFTQDAKVRPVNCRGNELLGYGIGNSACCMLTRGITRYVVNLGSASNLWRQSNSPLDYCNKCNVRFGTTETTFNVLHSTERRGLFIRYCLLYLRKQVDFSILNFGFASRWRLW